jgi:hypothetical protein
MSIWMKLLFFSPEILISGWLLWMVVWMIRLMYDSYRTNKESKALIEAFKREEEKQ